MVAYSNQWRSQPKNLGRAKKFWGGKMFHFRRIALFCLVKRLSKQKMTIFSENLGAWLLSPSPVYVYVSNYSMEVAYL